MQTRTGFFNGADLAIEFINDMEGAGWAVRQIAVIPVGAKFVPLVGNVVDEQLISVVCERGSISADVNVREF